MEARERRRQIVEYLSSNKSVDMSRLAEKFNVSIRTIQRDLNVLSLHYPIVTTRGRYAGGVSFVKGFQLRRNYLTLEEQALLEKILPHLSERDQIVMKQILGSFVPTEG